MSVYAAPARPAIGLFPVAPAVVAAPQDSVRHWATDAWMRRAQLQHPCRKRDAIGRSDLRTCSSVQMTDAVPFALGPPGPAVLRTGQTDLLCLGRPCPAATSRMGLQMSQELLIYINDLRAFSRKLCGNHAEADDLVQQTLLRAIENERHYTPGGYRRAWLRKIMRNAFLNNRRKQGRETTGSQSCVSSVPTSAPDQEWCMRRTELLRRLDDMPSHYRDAIVLVGVKGESYTTAAHMLRCDIRTIKSRVSRARTMLRQATA